MAFFCVTFRENVETRTTFHKYISPTKYFYFSFSSINMCRQSSEVVHEWFQTVVWVS